MSSPWIPTDNKYSRYTGFVETRKTPFSNLPAKHCTVNKRLALTVLERVFVTEFGIGKRRRDGQTQFLKIAQQSM